jgi:hypothetical protein
MDNEAAENAEEIIQFCNSIGVIVLNFPPYLGHFLNVCDNRVHATVQRIVDQLQSNFTRPSAPSLEEKYWSFVTAYNQITKDEVLNSLRSIGFGNLVSVAEAEKHFIRTLSEGLPNHRDDHIIQLEAFLNDCIDSGIPIPCSPYNYRLPGDLWDVYYDALDLQTEIHGEV